jgi:hypothetical protein
MGARRTKIGFGERGWNGFFVRRAPNPFGDALGDAAGGDDLRMCSYVGTLLFVQGTPLIFLSLTLLAYRGVVGLDVWFYISTHF